MSAPELVVGAGPAGAAYVLQRLSDGHDPPLWVGGPRRGPVVGEALPPDVPPLLASLGAEEALAGARPSHGAVSAWETESPGHSDFLLSGLGHGWQLDRAAFDAALVRVAVQRGATLLDDSLVGLRRDEGEFAYTLRSGRTGRASRAIDATGRAASVASLLGATRRTVDRLVAVLGRLGLPNPRVSRVHIEAVDIGWWYLGPIPGEQAVVALFTDSDLLRAAGLAEPRAWRAALDQTRLIRPLVGEETVEPGVVPATTGSLDLIAGPDWVAVGDAACTFDPLSSAGIAKALASGLRAAREDAERYALAQTRAFEAYLDQRREHYGRVRRHDGPFWRRRCAPLQVDPDALIPSPGTPCWDAPLSGREWALVGEGGRAADLVRRLGAKRRHVDAVQAILESARVAPDEDGQ